MLVIWRIEKATPRSQLLLWQVARVRAHGEGQARGPGCMLWLWLRL